jgi:alpha-ketoglutarate-dependent taurine dioxygenase
MKKVTEELRYDGATIQQVNAMLADPAFREQVCEYQHVSRHTVQIKTSGRGMTVVVDQIQAARGIPSFAK